MRNGFVFSLLVAILVVSCTPPLGTRTTATPLLPTFTPIFTPQAQNSPLSPYAADGQYSVVSKGFTGKVLDQSIPVTIWYPIGNGSASTPQPPYPLVVFSPGLGGKGIDYEYLIGPIVSHGFFFMSGDILDENVGNMWPAAAYRPLITLMLIDFAEKLTAPGGELAGMIDMEQIATMGHSSGGWTALIGGGAQMNLGWCAAASPNDLGRLPAGNCSPFVAHQQEIAVLLGLKSAPTGLWPQTYDKRVDAVIAMSPDGDIWGKDYEGVASLKAPVLIMAGSADTINPPELCAYPIYVHLGSQDKSLFEIEGAGHGLLFTNSIKKNTYALSVTRHITVAFLLAHLKGDAEAKKALLPANFTFSDIQYKTTGFGSK